MKSSPKLEDSTRLGNSQPMIYLKQVQCLNDHNLQSKNVENIG